MVYLNNAATSFPKPPSVVQAMTEALANAPVSALRSNLSESDGVLTDLRRKLGTLFHIADYERIYFCSSATDAVNRVLGGLRLSSIKAAKDNHNSVLRPLMNDTRYLTTTDLEGKLDTRPLPPSNLEGEQSYLDVSGTRAVSPSFGGDLVLKRTKSSTGEAGTGTGEAGTGTGEAPALILPHCSNVTGEIHDIRQICHEAHRQGRLVMVDAAQSAGCIPIDVDGWGIDILVFTGHKALFGPTGTGGYYVRRGIDLRPTQWGGTGRDSSVIRYDDGDWEYEVGTQNAVGLAGLRAGVDYVLERGVENIFRRLQTETLWLIHALQEMPRVKVYSAQDDAVQGPVVSFNIEGLHPADVGYILQNSYGITVRTGLHCAPLIHEDLGTQPDGTVRASLSDFTTHEDLIALAEAVGDICQSLKRK